jgi:hypothetical protein
MEDRPGTHDRPDRMKAVLERAHDAEVPTTAAEAPEEVRVLILAGHELLALGRHQVDRDQVVDRGAVLSHEPADAAAQGETRDAGVGDDPADRRQAVKLRLAVELSPEHAGLGPGGARRRVDPYPLHVREVDHESAVAERVTPDAVAAGADRHRQLALAREANGRDDVGDPAAERDAGGMAVDRSVPDRASGVVARVARQHHLAAERVCKSLEPDLIDRLGGHAATVRGASRRRLDRLSNQAVRISNLALIRG